MPKLIRQLFRRNNRIMNKAVFIKENAIILASWYILHSIFLAIMTKANRFGSSPDKRTAKDVPVIDQFTERG